MNIFDAKTRHQFVLADFILEFGRSYALELLNITGVAAERTQTKH